MFEGKDDEAKTCAFETKSALDGCLEQSDESSTRLADLWWDAMRSHCFSLARVDLFLLMEHN